MVMPDAHAGEESLVILQTLLCLLREKNLLTRSDIEDLCERVAMRAAAQHGSGSRSAAAATSAAATEMARIGSYIGQHYGGKHRRA